MTRDELHAEIDRLEQRRRHILGHSDLDHEMQYELHRIRSQMKAVREEILKLKTADWKSNANSFGRIFKRFAKQELDVETYDMLVEKTKKFLERRHSALWRYERERWEGKR